MKHRQRSQADFDDQKCWYGLRRCPSLCAGEQIDDTGV
jgi:hypothetical protein